jgi:Spy/CpxP family protein refolding chaperone
MRTIGKLALAVGVLALTATSAHAQGGGGGFGMFGGTRLLTNKSVQKELKVTDEQAQKLDAFAEEMGNKAREQGEKIRELPEDERPAKFREWIATFTAEVRKGAGEILKPEQTKRLDQIQVQQMGANSFGMLPRVQEALKLTDEQKAKVKEITDELNQARRDAFQDFQSDREGTMKKVAELSKQATDKAVAVLTDDQKKSWKELTGEPFEVKFEPPRPRN